MKKLLLMIVLAIGFATTLQAQYTSIMKARLADTILDGDRIDYCTDTLILYKPNAALSNISYTFPNNGGTIYAVDSVILTKKNNGRLTFGSSQISLNVDIYLASSIPATGIIRDTSFCEAGFKPFLLYAGDLNCRSYQWYGGNPSSNDHISINHFDTFICKEINGCGPNWDTAVVFQHNSHPKLSLGSDVTTCDGNEVVLTPNYTDYVSYNWVKTGKTGVRDTVYTTNKYKLKTVDQLGCFDSAEKDVTFVESLPQRLCYVTFNDTFSVNELNWAYDTAFKQAVSMIVLRRDTLGDLLPTDTIPYGTKRWLDMTSKPQGSEYEYATIVLDSCGNPSDTSESLITIRLLTAVSPGQINFSWTAPKARETVKSFVLNGKRTNGSIKYVGTTAFLGKNISGSEIDTAVEQYFVTYSVTACSSRMNVRSSIDVQSNFARVKITGIKPQIEPLSVKVYPTFTTGIINIESSIKISVQLTDMTGKVLLTTTEDDKNQSINITSYPAGTYLLLLQSPNGAKTTKKIMKQ